MKNNIMQIIPAPAGLFLYHQKSDGTMWKKERVAALALINEQGSQFVIGLLPGIDDFLWSAEELYPNEENTMVWSEDEHIFLPGVCECQGGCACSGNCAKP